MYRVILWGAGKNVSIVAEEIDKEKAVIVGIIDSDPEKTDKISINGLTISSPSLLIDLQYDYLVITVERHEEIYDQCLKMGIPKEKIIAYWDYEDTIFVKRSKAIKKLKVRNHILECRLDSIPYELEARGIPRILSGENLLNELINRRLSLSRFGDGEFEIIRGKNRAWFQKKNNLLAKRLLEVLNSHDDRVLIAIAQNFLLDRYKEGSADNIRSYMYGDTRKEILNMLDMSRSYYDAYVTRPYIIYKDSQNASLLFSLFHRLWLGRKVIIVEGEYSRFGVGNDLLSGCTLVRRIICPHKNAWDLYGRIKNAVLSIAHEGDDLILISLGPTATVLAYDLALGGLQAIDIGQLDNEYVWWKERAEFQTDIPGKLVAECRINDDFMDFRDDEYESQIVKKIL